MARRQKKRYAGCVGIKRVKEMRLRPRLATDDARHENNCRRAHRGAISGSEGATADAREHQREMQEERGAGHRHRISLIERPVQPIGGPLNEKVNAEEGHRARKMQRRLIAGTSNAHPSPTSA
jgi:hypothetical protein